MNDKIGYKSLIKWLKNNEDEKDNIQKVYCEDFITFEQLASYYKTTPMVMRRIVMEILGEDGYLAAKNQRKFNRKKTKKWSTSRQQHVSTKVMYSVIKLLQDTEDSFFSISKKLGCSRERVGQIARDCQHYGIKLNEQRALKHKNSKYYTNIKIRGYEKA